MFLGPIRVLRPRTLYQPKSRFAGMLSQGVKKQQDQLVEII